MTDTEVADDFSELAAMLAQAEKDAERTAGASDPQLVAASRRRRKRVQIGVAVVALAVAATVGTYIPLTLLAPIAAAEVTVAAPDVGAGAAFTAALPPDGALAVSVAGAEQFAGTEFAGTEGVNGILAATGGNEPRPIASISKVITALVVLDAKPITLTDYGPDITFTKADADLYDEYYVQGATVQPMNAGTTMSERQALEIMLVASASNYADAVSTWAFGSRSNFRSAAASWLAAHGLVGTTIVEPTGLDPRNRSTPTDLLAIAKLAMAHPVMAVMVQLPSVVVPNANGAQPNSNTMLGSYGINGIKTGTLEEAGACLLFSAELEVGTGSTITVVGVVLGGWNHASVNARVHALLESVKAGFHEVPLLATGQELGSYSTPWKDDGLIVAGGDASIVAWSDTPITSTVKMSPITTGAGGSEVGAVTFVAGATTVTVPLILSDDIEEPDAWWRLTHPGELFAE